MDEQARAIMEAEVGSYMKTVSPATPVGVCRGCLIVRTRQEFDALERCPSALLAVGLGEGEGAPKHQWASASSREELTQLLKEGAPRMKALRALAGEIFPPPKA